jgi:hypothetical protein
VRQQLLDCTGVATRLQPLGSEGVAEGMQLADSTIPVFKMADLSALCSTDSCR